MAANVVVGVTGPDHGIPWAWWATRWQLRRYNIEVRRLNASAGELSGCMAGVVIGGGSDIDPGVYGGDVSTSKNVDRRRDDYELGVLEQADARGLPIFGICRGAQLINVHAGGTLVDDLARHRVLTSNKASLLPSKAVEIVPQSLVAQWLGATSTRVNSLHHQAVRQAGKNLKIVARDRDNIVQAIESNAGPLRIGVQWHPEYMPQCRPQRQLFCRFVDACHGYFATEVSPTSRRVTGSSDFSRE